MKEKNQTTVVVVTVGTNEGKWLDNAFTTLLESDTPNFNLKIIYVDNHSSDNSQELVRKKFPEIFIISNKKNLGFAAANNRGIQYALDNFFPKYIFFVNPDTKTPKNLIKNLVNFMDSNQDFGIIGPLQLNYYTNNYGVYTLNGWSKEVISNGSKNIFHMDLPGYSISESGINLNTKYVGTNKLLFHCYVQGAAMFVKTNIKDFSLYFNEDYHTFYEEVDMCRRARWAGYKIAVLSNIYIHHFGGGSTKISHYKRKLMMRNKYYFLFTDSTWKVRDIFILTFKWLLYDIKHIFFKYPLLFINNIFYLLIKFPKILRVRNINKNYSKKIRTNLKKLKPL